MLQEISHGQLRLRPGNVLVDETRLLGGVRRDVQFMRDEMESMNAFLFKIADANEDNDPQVRAWLNQVRDVAVRSEFFVDRYVYCLDGTHDAGCCGPLRHFARLLATILARHRLATHIRDLTARARDVGERRMRYGVIDMWMWRPGPARQMIIPISQPERRPEPELDAIPDQHLPRAIDSRPFGELDQPEAAIPGEPVPAREQQHQRAASEHEDLERRRILADDDSDLLTEVSKELLDRIPLMDQYVHFLQHREPNVISILGLRGTGKTILARKVHDMYGQYDPDCSRTAYWISLGDDQSSKKVLESILVSIAPNVPGVENVSSWEQGSILGMIIRRLNDTRFLLVFDDVRSESLMSDIGDIVRCNCYAGSAILLVTSIPQVAATSCNPQNIFDFNDFPEQHKESLINFFLERAVSLVANSQQNDLLEVLKSILTRCAPSIFTMKMLLRCLFVNPNRNIEELRDLNNSLQPSSALNANSMLNFCYRSLPSHYRNCLAYLAISPRNHTFRRTSLTTRWLAEGLISRTDVTSASEEPSDVANRCFDALCNHRFLLPAGDFTGTSFWGRFKSCTVHGIVRDFLSTIMEDEGVVDEDLFPDMAKRISIQNEFLHACRDRSLVESLATHPGLHLINVLDLEGCSGFQAKDLKVICTRARHLTYLSLRDTGIYHLPKQIQELHNLQTLDIRQTNVRVLNVVFPRLKYLLAGKEAPSGGSFSTVKMPDISFMTDMEVLYHVEISSQDDGLIDLGRLRRLRKLGVVFNRGRVDLMKFLLSQIQMLESCLRSLSIRIIEGATGSEAENSGSGYSLIDSHMLSPPRLLQTLNIRGARGGLPRWMTELHQLAKITLRETYLTEDALRMLGSLRGLQCLRFLRKALTEGTIIFRDSEFKKLVDLSFEGSYLSTVIFDNGTAPKLERVAFKVPRVASLHGIQHLPSLKELEFIGNLCEEHIVKKAIAEHSNHPHYTYLDIDIKGS